MNTMVLVGHEEVQRAGATMYEAARTMSAAASQIEDTFQRQQRFLDDWLYRFEQVFQERAERKEQA